MVIAGLSVCIFALGTFQSTGRIIASTYFCFEPLASRPRILFLQILGLGLDAVIVVLVWRILSWSRTMKLRLRTLASVLVLSSVAVGFMWMASTVLAGPSRITPAFESLYGFDILVDSVAFSVLAVCATTWMCETSPLLPASVITVLVGVWSSAANSLRFGGWMHPSSGPILLPLWILVFGAILFMSCHDVQRLFFVRRTVIAVLLVLFAIVVTYKSSTKESTTYPRHPISDLIYKANTAHQRWVLQATTSETLKVATVVYEERHPGKAPPPNFDRWYEYAQDAFVIDTFDQIDDDLLPFWNIKPEVLRKRADDMADVPGVSVITIKDGKVTHSDTGDDQQNKDLKELSTMIGKFSAHLPDMVLPINLSPSPRILPTWEEANGKGQADLGPMAALISKRSLLSVDGSIAEPTLHSRDDDSGPKGPVSAELVSPNDFRKMLAQACPPDSPLRTRPQWNFAEFCSSCIEHHSKHAFITGWHKSMETCQEPDLKNLHEIFMTSPKVPPVPKLMPLFSLSKTDAFKDILIPLPRTTLGGEPDMKWDFTRRYDSLFWRGDVGSQEGTNTQAICGSQKYRLLHMFLDPSPRDEVTLLLPVRGRKNRFTYEKASVQEASSVAPFDMGVSGFSECRGDHCELVREVFGAKDEGQEPLEYRYVLQVDEDGGPPPQLMRTIRSNSVPLVSTIFRSWYTERVQPYLHFVPVDPRYHSLHTTYLYFTGTAGKGKINGRDTKLKGRPDDGEWIAREGKKWARQALGEKDMEAYLFRLLLEWGRLIDDNRDSIGYLETKEGERSNVGWTRRKEES